MKQGELARPILEDARAGDVRAFRALYEHHADAVYGFLWRMLRDDGAAEDALQEVFMRVLRGLGHFDPDGPARLSTWIFAIARRVALTALERYRERGRTEGPRMAGPAAEMRSHLRLALEAAVSALPEVQRTVFLLYECCHLSYEEIAGVEGVDLGTVKSRLHRARAALQEKLRDEMDDEERGNGARATR